MLKTGKILIYTREELEKIRESMGAIVLSPEERETFDRLNEQTRPSSSREQMPQILTQEEIRLLQSAPPHTPMSSPAHEPEETLTEISLDSPEKKSPEKPSGFGFWDSIGNIFAPRDDEQQPGSKPSP